jgi:mono/diheme cytochrome c family protein
MEEAHPMMKAALASLALAVVLSASSGARAQDKPVSFSADIVPIFKASCNECHNPKKAKGKLDMSSYAALKKGGKKGTPWKEGDPDKSLLVEVVKGPMPEMPEDGDPLKPEQVALIARWIKEGAKDDTK